MPATQTAPAALPTFTATRTFFVHAFCQSNRFRAQYAGTCAWTGLPFFAGDEVVRTAEGLVSCNARLKWNFRTCSAPDGQQYGGAVSDFERVTDPDAALARCMVAGQVVIHTASGKVERLTVRSGGQFVTPAWSTRSAKQVRALLAKATAFAIYPL